MKIGIDISQVVYGTGVASYTSNLIENLAKIDKKNQYVLFGTSLRNLSKLNDLKERLKDYQNFQFKIFPIPPTILEILWNRLHVIPVEKFIGEIDIFHSSDWTQPPVKSKSTKKITTVHDMVVYLFPSSVHPRILTNQMRRLGHVKKEVEAIIADSQTTKEDIIKFMEINRQKITVIPLAASSIFKPQDDSKINEVTAKYKIKKPYILSVATQEPRKNIQKLLDVFGKIVSERPQFHLVLAGKYGWGRSLPAHSSLSGSTERSPSNVLRAHSSESKTGRQGFHSPENVTWTGYVPQEDLPALYAGSRVFVYPSLYEGFGLPVLEAMACGTPVITSNNSSMAEIAKDAAILVDPRSESQLMRAIELVLGLNLENYQKMVRASLDRARQYSWTKTARETLKIYEEVAKNSE